MSVHRACGALLPKPLSPLSCRGDPSVGDFVSKMLVFKKVFPLLDVRRLQ